MIHIKDAVPKTTVILIAVLHVPSPGIPLAADLPIVKRQGAKAPLRPDAGQHKFLPLILIPAAHIGLKRPYLQLHGFLKIMAPGIVIQDHIKIPHNKIHSHHIDDCGNPHNTNHHHHKKAKLFL